MRYALLAIAYGLLIDTCSSSSGFHLYRTVDLSRGGYDRDCLHYFVPRKGLAHQFVQFCIRFPMDELQVDYASSTDAFTFEQLAQNNVTADHLYQWSAPIHLIEHYQSYLENRAPVGEYLFYNCTFPWFGSRCEYRFDEPQSHFSTHVEASFQQKVGRGEIKPSILPCYEHVQCDRGPTAGACLDWREVCDGKMDCIDGGHDEELCWQLEMNDCDDSNEYRCQNGLCIPLAFLHDDGDNADCLDRTDEISFANELEVRLWTICKRDPAFRCEDHKCHTSIHREYAVECGDGSCVRFWANCHNNRDVILRNLFWSRANVSDMCRFGIECYTRIVLHENELSERCLFLPFTFIHDIAQYCPRLIQIPPILFGHVRLIYTNNQTVRKFNISNDNFVAPDYICYNDSICDSHLFLNPWHRPIDLFGDRSACRPFTELQYPSSISWTWAQVLTVLHRMFQKCSAYQHFSLPLPDKSGLYQCINSSKMISPYRLVNGIVDCLHGDDESYTESCSLEHYNHRFKCDQGKNVKCLAHLLVWDGSVDCNDSSDEKYERRSNLQTSITFQTMCDGYIDLQPIMVGSRNETDETDCNSFPCNNTYTRCDGFWNCPDGADEVNCEWPPVCPPLHHLCLSPVNGNVTCLHVKHVNDGIDDCYGASDERQFCRQASKSSPSVRYRCLNTDRCISSHLACLKPSLCPANSSNSIQRCHDVGGPLGVRCSYGEGLTHIEQVLCTLTDMKYKTTAHFALIGSTSYATLKMPALGLQPVAVVASEKSSDRFAAKDDSLVWLCNRGIMIRRSIDRSNDTMQVVCLCPPAYYGQLCQYQNQRVSLTIRVRASFEFRTLFAVVVTLRDDQEGQIQSSDQITYFYDRDCRTKFNIYLLYRTRPKNSSANYSVHIDVFNKQQLEHHTSWLFAVQFPVLPVYRLAVQLQIPPKRAVAQKCTTLNCGGHGRCSHYANTRTSFCLCHPGWSGKYCHISHVCHCSLDSVCVAANLCVCPLAKFGPRCYLRHSKCLCNNGGTCVPADERLGNEVEHSCLCPKGFSGSTCQTRDTMIALSFAPQIPAPPSILIHFIEVLGTKQPHRRSTTFKRIEVGQGTVSFQTSSSFHILFVEPGHTQTYYLILLQHKPIPSLNVTSIIRTSDRCLSINEIYNETFASWHLLRRLKYYHLACEERPDRLCFYDDVHMCICDPSSRQANCLLFNHSQTYDCEEQNPCEHQGQCFRDNPSCPTTFMCICNECSYGSRCQFSTKGFGLSLDAILGSYIQPHRAFSQQRLVIHVTTAIVILIFLVGIIGSVFSIMTFQTKKIREVGCGYYLLASSFTSMITIILFALKFYFLLVSQMGTMTNRDFLTFNCIFIEYTLKVLLSAGDWLHALVGIERAVTVGQDVAFNKTRAKKLAKRSIFCTYLITALTHAHDPIYRRLIDDNEADEQNRRRWCHVQFTSSLQLFNSIMLATHFFIPFLLNIISALFIIISTARQRATARKQQPYTHQLRRQVYELKHLLISPVILTVFASPRLAISFASGCMKTRRELLWVYLTGYLLSFLPPMLLFVVFVLPSDTYKQEFGQTVKRMRRYLRTSRFL